MLYLLLALQISAAPLVENGTPVDVQDPLRNSVAKVTFARTRCSATFITSKTLLTAGHCVKGQNAASTTVSLQDGLGRWHHGRARRLLLHPRYRLAQSPTHGWQVANDFGLIILEDSMADVAAPLPIADPRNVMQSFPVTVAGFGKQSKTASSSVLRKGSMIAKVGRIAGFFNEVGLHMIAADSRRQFTCPGDSGGPVLVKESQGTSIIGVHSLSSGCLGDSDALSLSQLPALVFAWIQANRE